MDALSGNPLIDVWNGLWRMMEQNANLEAVRERNRIAYRGPLGPKKTISQGDLPELQLLSAGGEIEFINSSSSSRINKRYSWGLVTGEYDITKIYFPLIWEVYRAMHNWDVVLCALVWPLGSDWHYVTNVQISDLDEGLQMTDLNRQIEGWTSVMSIQVEMFFPIEHLRV